MPDSGTPVGVDPARRRLAGPLLVLTTAFAVLGTLGWPVFALLGGLTAWGALVLLLPLVMPMMRRIALALLAVGGLTMVWAWLGGQVPDWRAALASNVPLIGLLIAATFLQLLVLPRAGPGRVEGARDSGPKAFLRTGLAVQLFGAVINLSMVTVAASRLSVDGRLGRAQTVLLGRFFTAALFWSPFFGAMAAALSYAPGATLGSVLPAGLVMSVLAVALTWWGTGRRVEPSFVGYPVDFRNLWLPGLLATLVVGIHLHWPALSVLGLIMLLAPSMVLLVLLIRQPRTALRLLGEHVLQRVPNMSNELLLFLSAGVMAAGLAALVAGLGGWTPFQSFGPVQAWLTVLGIVVLAGLGAHPLVGVALFGTLLAPMQPPPTLLAVSFLTAWGIASVGSPFSGLSLMLQGLYRVQPLEILRWHWRYVLGMLALSFPVLWVVETISG
jgi:hypothetical protein